MDIAFVPAVERALPLSYADMQAKLMQAFLAELPSYANRFYAEREDIQTLRTSRLRALIATAKARSPWHARRLGGIDVHTVQERDLAAVPTMSKHDVMTHFDEIVTDPRVTLADVELHLANLRGDAFFKNDCHAVCSGGSSGLRGAYAFDWEGWLEFGLSSARPIVLMLTQAPREARERAVVCVGTSAAHGSAAFTLSFAPWLASQFRSLTPLPMSLPLDAMIDQLNVIQPTSICAYPSLLFQLCMAADAGRLNIRPLALLVGGEPLLPEHKEAFQRVFGAQVFDFYGCSEASCIGISCPTGSGMHLCDDSVIIEALDETGAPVTPGNRSAKLLLTNLFNQLLPLIRYEIDDSIVLADDNGICGCGSSFQRVSEVAGRSDDIFVYGTIQVHPFVFRSVLGRERAILEYQVRQTERGAAVFAVMAAPQDLPHVGERLRQALSAQGLDAPQITIEPVEKIERGPAGKLRRFLSL